MNKTILFIGLIVMLALITSCSNSQTKEPVYASGPLTVVTVFSSGIDNTGKMDLIEISDESKDLYELWMGKKQQREEQDKYDTYRDVYAKMRIEHDNGQFYDEEKRIEAYCEENGYLKCITIDETCDEEGCRKVTITCKDKDFDASELDYDEYDKEDECRNYDVEIDDNVYEDTDKPKYT